MSLFISLGLTELPPVFPRNSNFPLVVCIPCIHLIKIFILE
jgi:hypothetical protein